MRFKLLASIALITVIVGVALAWRSTSQSREPATIKVVINQLAVKDGAIPIEIIQPTISSSSPNKLEDFTYIIRNNSAKAIVALAVSKTISYEEGGEIYATSLYSMMDYAFHPDMAGANLLQPGAQALMESGGPLSFSEGALIKEITLKLDFVSYDDHTGYGLGGEGNRRIDAMREGAREYKNWIVQRYSRGGKSLATIIPLMQSPIAPEELRLSLDQSLGADRYRFYLLKTLRTKGAAGLERYFRPDI